MQCRVAFNWMSTIIAYAFRNIQKHPHRGNLTALPGTVCVDNMRRR